MSRTPKPNTEIARLLAVALDASQPTTAHMAAVAQLGDIVDATKRALDVDDASDHTMSDDERAAAEATLVEGAAALRRIERRYAEGQPPGSAVQ